MKQFYADVTVIKVERERVLFSAKKKPNKKQMLKILQESEYEDITDNETIEYKEVTEIEFNEDEP